MNHAAVLSLLVGLLLAPGQLPHASGPANAEQVETGSLRSAGGAVLSYRIRLLPLTSFPNLPPAVVTQLLRRNCMIPQSFEAQQPENVISGSFRAQDSDDWAALCSVSGDTTLYVFFQGAFNAPIALRVQPDTAWLGAEPGSSLYGSAWGIAVHSASMLRHSPQFHHFGPFDHDGIDDARLEHSLTIHYYRDGEWLTFAPSGGGD